MYKLWATIIKDLRVLTRDKVGLTLMFAMPILLVLVITSIQNSTFELVNKKKMALLVCNKDTGQASQQLTQALERVGLFEVQMLPFLTDEKQIQARMHETETLVGLIIPSDFTQNIQTKANKIAAKALEESSHSPSKQNPILSSELLLFYHPVLDEAFRHSIQGALQSSLQIIEGRETIQTLYVGILDKKMPSDLEKEVLQQSAFIKEIPASRDGSGKIPNATQHNVPAWTLFAMFFIVISLGGSVVKEKQSGSFIRLKTLPTSFHVALVSKQVTYLIVTLLQVVVIFSLGMWFFPVLHLPALSLPADLVGLSIVSIVCGWAAVSYAICVGVVAFTQEQANGFGAVSIVILSAIGGILVPSFAMPESFELFMKLSPLHWGLESYYILFLEHGKTLDFIPKLLPLLLFIALMQGIAWYTLKRKNLI